TDALQLSKSADANDLVAKVLRERGKTRQVLGRFREAQEDYETALAIVGEGPSSTRTELLHLLVAAHLVSGEVSEARRRIDEVRETDTSEKHIVLHARVLIAEGALREAQALLDNVISRSDAKLVLASAHYNLAEVHFARGDYPESARSNLRAETLYKDHFGADHYSVNQTTHRQAILFQETGDFEASLDLFTVAQSRTQAKFGKAHPTWIATEIERSSTLVKLGRLDLALDSLRELVRRDLSARSGLLARSSLGLRLFEAGQSDEAYEILVPVVADWRSGAFGFADAPPTMIALADLHSRRGEPREARRVIDFAIELLTERGANSIDRLSEARRIKASIQLSVNDETGARDLIEQNLQTAAAQVANLALTSGFGVNFAPDEIRNQIAQAIDFYWGNGGSGKIRTLTEDMFFAMQLAHLNENSAAAIGTLVASQDKFGPLLEKRQRL
ncbi:unnamed protein product, partial [Ectocarpus sp. 12 AP-2014]